MAIDDAVNSALDNDTFIVKIPTEKKLKKESRWKNDVDIDILIVDDELKHDIVAFCERKDYYNTNYWIERNRVMKEYTRQCAEHLMNKYNWPKRVAMPVAKALHIPRKKTSLSSILANIGLGYSVASWPERYLDPPAELMGVKRKVYTNANIIVDVAWFAAYAYALFSKDNSHFWITHQIHNLQSNDFVKLIEYLNFGIRGLQIPVRAYYNNFKDKHLWSPASLINPNLAEMAGMIALVSYDMVQTYPRLKTAVNKIKTYPPFTKTVNGIKTYAKSSYAYAKSGYKSLQQIVEFKSKTF